MTSRRERSFFNIKVAVAAGEPVTKEERRRLERYYQRLNRVGDFLTQGQYTRSGFAYQMDGSSTYPMDGNEMDDYFLELKRGYKHKTREELYLDLRRLMFVARKMDLRHAQLEGEHRKLLKQQSKGGRRRGQRLRKEAEATAAAIDRWRQEKPGRSVRQAVKHFLKEDDPDWDLFSESKQTKLLESTERQYYRAKTRRKP